MRPPAWSKVWAKPSPRVDGAEARGGSNGSNNEIDRLNSL